eukprot:6187255-Pleurochrysis_carterae.AAC.2
MKRGREKRRVGAEGGSEARSKERRVRHKETGGFRGGMEDMLFRLHAQRDEASLSAYRVVRVACRWNGECCHFVWPRRYIHACAPARPRFVDSGRQRCLSARAVRGGNAPPKGYEPLAPDDGYCSCQWTVVVKQSLSFCQMSPAGKCSRSILGLGRSSVMPINVHEEEDCASTTLDNSSHYRPASGEADESSRSLKWTASSFQQFCWICMVKASTAAGSLAYDRQDDCHLKGAGCCAGCSASPP